MRAFAAYALAAAGVVAAGAGLAAWLLGPAAASGVWWAAGAAYGVQLGAFAALVAARRRRLGFFAAWGAGMLVRLGLVAGVAVWLARTAAYPPAPLLVSLAGFLFLLLLLEPLFFRLGLRSQ